MNALLGGMFTSRLNLNLRERHGFTYGVRTAFGFRRAGGTFVTATAVATDVTTRALEEILGELQRIHTDGATADEVAVARDYLAGVMPLELQTAGEVADALSDLFVHDLPDDWHRRHREALGAVPVDEVARVAQQHLHPDAVAIVVVGDADKVSQDLATLGRGPVESHEADE
jgi:zinc protease